MKRSICLLLLLTMFGTVCAQVGVVSFGPLRLGGSSPIQPGDPTAYPHKVTPRAKFYVLVVAKGLPTMCTFEDCGTEGYLVESLGGWITGDTQGETIALVGLDEVEVKRGRQSIVVISDSSTRIVGIYPNYRMRDLPSILRSHGFTESTRR
jgi:hypothetical protein